MTDERWFSAKLRFAIVVEPTGGDTLYDRIFLMKATDFDAAFRRATDIGQSEEKEYRNADGQRVKWKFMEVISLDIIPSDELEGQEVYSEPIHLDHEKVIPFEAEFNPQASKPHQTI